MSLFGKVQKHMGRRVVTRLFGTAQASTAKNRIIYSEFANKNVVVTGAGDGIGNGICRRFGEQGANVIAISKTQSKLDGLPSSYCTPICADLSDASNIRGIAQDLISAKPDFLINSAGVSIAMNGADKFLNLEFEQGLRKVHSVNFDSVFVLSQAICRHWVEQQIAGRIVHISSAASKATLSEHIAYTTSKYALDGLTKTMALELGEYGIRVNSVHPTVTLTPMAMRVWYESDGVTPTAEATALLAQIPMGRFIEVDEVADAVFWLLSDSATMMHGQLISLDGGLTV